MTFVQETALTRECLPQDSLRRFVLLLLQESGCQMALHGQNVCIVSGEQMTGELQGCLVQLASTGEITFALLVEGILHHAVKPVRSVSPQSHSAELL